MCAHSRALPAHFHAGWRLLRSHRRLQQLIGAEEAQRLARKAGEALSQARADEAAARSARSQAEANGDTRAAENAKREAIKSEYSFKPGLNYYARGSPAS